MNWEIYKLLTKEEKEEYDYKYYNILSFKLTKTIGKILFNIYLLIWVIFSAAFSYLNLGKDYMQLDIEQLNIFGKGIIGMIDLFSIFIFFISIIYIIEFIFNIYYSRKRLKWLDKIIYQELINNKIIYKRIDERIDNNIENDLEELKNET